MSEDELTVLRVLSPALRAIESDRLAREPLTPVRAARLADPICDARRALILLDDALGELEVELADGRARENAL